MGTQVSLAYTVEVVGPRLPASIQAAVAAVPLPLDIIAGMGLRVISDNTVVGPPVVRTVVLGFLPVSSATATSFLFPGDASGSPIRVINVGGIVFFGGGDGYIRPPQVVIADNTVPPVAFGGLGPLPQGATRRAQAKAFLVVNHVANLVGGGAYSATPLVTFVGGLPPANANTPPFAVNDVKLLKKGRGYSSATVAQFRGTLAPGGHHAQAVLTFDANGGIASVTVTDPGSGYLTIPSVFLWDPAGETLGSGPASRYGLPAQLVVQPGMGTPATATATVGAGIITGITVNTAGSGYVAPPTIVITDTTGSGASAIASMGVQSPLTLVDPGVGYTTPPVVTLVPFFKSMFPDLTLAGTDPATLANQAKPFWDFLTRAIQTGVATPVTAAAPVVT